MSLLRTTQHRARQELFRSLSNDVLSGTAEHNGRGLGRGAYPMNGKASQKLQVGVGVGSSILSC